jgi:hypothetical protein
MKNNVIIVGINPSSGKPNKTSATIKRLNSWVNTLGIDYYSFTNVIHQPGPYKDSLVDKESLLCYIKGYKKVIALGPFVSKTLNSISVEHYTLPHPSPLNRQLNDKEYEVMKLKECKKFMESV